MANIESQTTSAGDTRYKVRWRAGGKAHSKTFRLQKDAKAYLRKVHADELVGITTDPSKGTELLADYGPAWVASRLSKGAPLSPSTRYSYERLFDRFIRSSELGDLALRAVTPDRVRTWYGDLANAAGSHQAAKSYRLLRAIMNTALNDDLVVRNPCRITGGGEIHSDERPMPTGPEVLALIQAMKDRYRLVVVLGGLGGLRTGETLGLRLGDVDMVRSAVRITQASQEVPGHGRIVRAPKSEAGVRTVALPPQAMGAIADHVETFGCAVTGELVTDLRGGPARRARVSEAWQEAKRTVGVDSEMHVHDLRHHAATMLAQIPGITTKQLMAHIGHSSQRAALIYQHATEEAAQFAAVELGERYAAMRPARPRIVPISG